MLQTYTLPKDFFKKGNHLAERDNFTSTLKVWQWNPAQLHRQYRRCHDVGNRGVAVHLCAIASVTHAYYLNFGSP